MGAFRGGTAGNAVSAVQSNLNDLWHDERHLHEAHNGALSNVERRINELLQVAPAARLRRLGGSSSCVELSIKTCRASINDVHATNGRP